MKIQFISKTSGENNECSDGRTKKGDRRKRESIRFQNREIWLEFLLSLIISRVGNLKETYGAESAEKLSR